MAVERVLSNLNLISFKTEEGMQNHIDELQDGDLVFTPDNSLKTNQITNCITEIPQDIKLELNNGTLTLKAGSKVYIPNGAGVFDAVTTTADYNLGPSAIASPNTVAFVAYRNGSISIRPVKNSTSGAGTTAVSGFAYDTTTNKIKFYNSDGTLNSTDWSFPIAILTTDSSGVAARIDQVFNGFGYIGSTAFMLPGVTGLVPDGRNEDGSLKYTQITTTEITTYTRTENGGSFIGCLTGSKTLDNGYISYVVSETQPTTNFVLWYKPSANKIYTVVNGVATPSTRLIVWNEIRDMAPPYKITSFEPKSAFHAVDYNDIGFIAHQAMPSDRHIDLTLPASGGSVVAPSDGWISVSKNAGAQYTQIVLTTQNYISTQSRAGTNASAPVNCIIPVKQGSVVTVAYSASGSTNYFKFIYANGAK